MLEHHYTAAQGTAADRPAKNRNEVLPAVYLAPEVSVCAFAPEKGFALSAQTVNNAKNDPSRMGVADWNETDTEGEHFF